MSDLLEENILLISRLNFKFSYHGDCGLMSREKTEVREKSPERRIAPGNCRRQQGYHVIVVYNGYISKIACHVICGFINSKYFIYNMIS